MNTMHPTAHEKSGWSRMAQAAYAAGRNDIGHRYSRAAALPNDAEITLAHFDHLMSGYRVWLNDNNFAPIVPFIDLCQEEAYGSTTRLSFQIRVF